MYIKENNITIDMNNNKNFNIAAIGDLHLSEKSKRDTLTSLKDKLLSMKYDYLTFLGDNIDHTNLLYDNKELASKFAYLIENMAKKSPIVMDLGSHDFTTMDFVRGKEDWSCGYWDDISKINNVYVAGFNGLYTDKNSVIFAPGASYEYYYNDKNIEDKDLLIKDLKKKIEVLNKIKVLDNDKVKVLLFHSPIWMSDPKVLSVIKNFDIILSGHMHAGMLPDFLCNIIPSNRGLIAPNKSLFPDNARGIKKMKVNGKEIYLIITNGFTRLAESSNLYKFNFPWLYPANIENISINSKNQSLVRTR